MENGYWSGGVFMDVKSSTKLLLIGVAAMVLCGSAYAADADQKDVDWKKSFDFSKLGQDYLWICTDSDESSETTASKNISPDQAHCSPGLASSTTNKAVAGLFISRWVDLFSPRRWNAPCVGVPAAMRGSPPQKSPGNGLTPKDKLETPHSESGVEVIPGKK
jgi:hypothetical protein